jgi:hypothetical protein
MGLTGEGSAVADEILTIKNRTDRPSNRAIITTLCIKKGVRHWNITVWNRGGQAGILTVDAADGQTIVNKLIPPNIQTVQPEIP